jgi:hypothetical protein
VYEIPSPLREREHSFGLLVPGPLGRNTLTGKHSGLVPDPPPYPLIKGTAIQLQFATMGPTHNPATITGKVYLSVTGRSPAPVLDS